MKRPGIKDIAARAGVSTATVSYVMTGNGRVAQSTRLRVLEVAKELGFIRDDSAARLRTGRSRLIGVILNSIVNPFFTEVVGAMEATAYDADYLTLLATAQNDMTRQERLIGSMLAQGVAGIILSPVHGTSAEGLEPVLRRGTPMVVCMRDVAGSTASFVGVDDVQSGYLAGRALLSRGHRRFAFIGGYEHTTTWTGRSAGIGRALAEAGLPDSACLRVPGVLHPDFAEVTVLDMAARGALPPAVICFNDDQASGAYRAALRLGRVIGVDFSVVGFDNIPQGRILMPTLTTVDIFPAEVGRLSAEDVLRRLADPQAARCDTRLAPRLVERQSVAPAA